MANHLLITGPSRGGKSEWAERRVQMLADDRPITYLATGPALPDDESWQRRLNRHRDRRPDSWGLVEASTVAEVESVLSDDGPLADHLLLLDSLGGIVAAELDLPEKLWMERQERFLSALQRRHSCVVIVAEEVGWGVVPSTAVGGLFRDRNGSLSRFCEQHCNESWLVVSGRALPLHHLGERVNPLS